MINLLPPDLKSSYAYARRNIGLRRWLISLALVLVGVGLIATYGLLTMQQSVISYRQQADDVQASLQKEKLKQTEQQVKEISSSLRLATQVLSKEVLFSKLITQIGAAMPPGAVLSGLTINQTNGGLDLIADAKDYQTATQVQVNLSSSSNKIFAKADIVTIKCEGGIPNYPCLVTLRALFNADNQFLFVNQGTKS